MSFRDLHVFNKALLAKQAWRILENPNTLWAKTLKSIYFPNKTFLKAKCTNNCSWFWKSLISSKELLKKGICWEVGNGENIDFWKDPWIPTLRNFKLISIQPKECRIKKVKDVINPITKKWKEEILQNLILREEINEIKRIFISNNQHEDKIKWQYGKKGNYIVKSRYYVEMENKKPSNNKDHNENNNSSNNNISLNNNDDINNGNNNAHSLNLENNVNYTNTNNQVAFRRINFGT